MRRRAIASLIRDRLERYPVVSLIGARQSGKTTLARTLSKVYFDVEQPAERTRLDLEWESLEGRHRLVVIDEAQTWPELFPRIRATVDRERRRCGRYLLLGSVSPQLMREVSESLAGRLALVELTPFLLSELGPSRLDRLWLLGGFPDGGVLGRDGFPTWQHDYTALLAQRDLPSWGLAAKPQVTQRLMAMLAAVHGQIWNASRLGQSLGVSYHTVNSYLDFLEGAFLVRRLPPWNKNLSKRLVKSPKMYLRDSGILHALLGVTDRKALLTHPLVGASFEGFVVEQVLGHLWARGLRVDASYFRTSDGHEADLLLEAGTRKVVIEVKLASQASPGDMARLQHVADLCGVKHRYLVCQTPRPVMNDTTGVLDLPLLLQRIQEHFG